MKTIDGHKGFVVTEKFLRGRVGSGVHGVSRWIQFCRYMLAHGYTVTLYEARQTVSKYVTVHGINDDFFTVRFSNHKPNKGRELNGDCDFFCGVTHTGVRNIDDAIQACSRHFGTHSGRRAGPLVKEEQNKMEAKSVRRIAGSVAAAAGGAFIYYRDEKTEQRQPEVAAGERDKGTEEAGV